MKSDDKCCWPGCRNDRKCLYLDKPLCDKHGDLVQAEDVKVCNRSRKKIGLPPFPAFQPSAKPPPTPPPEPEKKDEEELDGLEDRLGSGFYDWDD